MPWIPLPIIPNEEPTMRIKHLITLIGCLGALQGFAAGSQRPNILLILVDDMGYSDVGCYGSEIQTPNIDALAGSGLRFTQMYNTSKCHPSRACLLTGVYAQQSGMAVKNAKIRNAVTLGEVLRPAGYRTYASGKHHGTENLFDRGFDHYYGLRDGSSNMWNPGLQREGEPVPGSKGVTRYWCDDATTHAPYTPEDRNFHVTDAFTNKALEWLEEKELQDQPFFLYLAYTAPHYPLHAWPEDIAKQKGNYDAGYEAIREARYGKQVAMGLFDSNITPLPEWKGGNWDRLDDLEREKEKRRMEIYAAMVGHVDRSVGKVIAKLKAQGKYENTLILFASDNGGCAEVSGRKVGSTQLEDFGTIASFETVGESWATVQNTPLREHKNSSYEGGIRTPFLVSWPQAIPKEFRGTLYHSPAHFIDIMPTLVELSGAQYPETFHNSAIVPMQGVSLLPALSGQRIGRTRPLFWHWRNGGAIRTGDIKAVFQGKQWQLFDLSQDHNESKNLAQKQPELLSTMKAQWKQWLDGVANNQGNDTSNH
ncbi:MAG: arylsulfatase [Bdellovibrionaceae bacterium]|nr:arylsulfatase [Pseudobdellovibrionaceae bacterium]